MALRKLGAMSVLALVALALPACASTAPNPAADNPAPSTVAEDSSPSTPAPPSEGDTTDDSSTTISWDHLTSCEIVGQSVSEFIDGLTLTDSEIWDGGITCDWQDPAPTDFANIRSMRVAVQTGESQPTKADLEATGLVTVLEDPVIAGAGGIIANSGTDSTAASAIVTTTYFPDLEVTIASGQFGDRPALDGPQAVSATKSLLRLG